METKEYIVSTIRGVDISEIDIEMVSPTGSETIPNRSCEICNQRPLSSRQTHYHLTDAEAEILRADPRIFSVEILPPYEKFTEAVQTGNFTKTTSDSGSFVNWGLKRCIAESNIYGTGTTVEGLFSYSADGSGVDIVIQDSGIQADHPDFYDENGISRVQQIDWYAEAGIAGSMPAGFYADYDGHGTHVAGIAAGRTYGWAKNARIYAMKVNGLQGTTDPNGGIDSPDCFDLITAWHNNKPIDPATGYKRPTVVNMSWGYGEYMYNISGGDYRGTPWSNATSGSFRDTAKGMIGVYANITLGYRHVVRVSSIDVQVQEMIDAGIHIFIAAGNSYQKIDVVGGDDYDNYYTGGYFNPGGTIYYHRGGSPFDDEAIVVGNIDSAVQSATLEYKANSSENGPGVDIWAPGTDIMSTTSNTNRFSGTAYPGDSNYKICNISGTSMASPQAAGVAACYLQVNPQMTPAQLKAKLIADSKTDKIYSTGLDTDYTNSRSIKGSNNRMLYNRYSQSVVSNVSGPLTTNVFVKNKK